MLKRLLVLMQKERRIENGIKTDGDPGPGRESVHGETEAGAKVEKHDALRKSANVRSEEDRRRRKSAGGKLRMQLEVTAQ